MDFWWLPFVLLGIGLTARYAWKTVARKQAGEISPLLNYRKGAFRAKIVALGDPSLPVSVDSASPAGLPTETVSTANASSRARLSAPLDERWTSRAFWGAAAIDTAIAPGVDIWMRWASVDSHVFQAVEHLSHEQIEGVADLLTVVDAKSYAIESAGFFNKLLGHVGEWHALEHLQQAEIPVSMPLGSNQEGWDIQAGDVGINVKTVQDAASAASSHFAKYPDLPIIVPGDAAHIPSDALYFDPSKGMSLDEIGSHHHQVIVDTALSHADVADQTQNAIDVVSDPGVHAHFPWVTAAVSGFREAKLLAKGHTDLARASKNVGIDVVAVGGAGAIGGKVGAVIGTAMGPIGTVVGGVIGAAIGGAMGRGAANQIKQKPLNEARQQYESAFATCQSKQVELESYAQQRWTQEKMAESKHLHDVSRDALQSLKAGVEKEKLELRSSVLFGREEAMTHLKIALEHMRSTVDITLLITKALPRILAEVRRAVPNNSKVALALVDEFAAAVENTLYFDLMGNPDFARRAEEELRDIVREVATGLRVAVEDEEEEGVVSWRAYQAGKRKWAARRVLAEIAKVNLSSTYCGDDTRTERDAVAEAFKMVLSPWVLVATNVGSEGIDLHRYTQHLVHFDLEWNPARLEQREGRIDRLGRKLGAPASVYFLLVQGTYDERMFHQLVARQRWHGVLLGKKAKEVDSDEGTDAPLIERCEADALSLDLSPR